MNKMNITAKVAITQGGDNIGCHAGNFC